MFVYIHLRTCKTIGTQTGYLSCIVMVHNIKTILGFSTDLQWLGLRTVLKWLVLGLGLGLKVRLGLGFRVRVGVRVRVRVRVSVRAGERVIV